MGLREFMAEVRTRGVAARSHYVVDITPPVSLMTSSDIVPVISLFCEQAMLPEFVLPTQSIKDGGINREVVYDKLYGQLSMTFMCDQQMVIKEFFDKWAMLPVKTDGGLFAYPASYIVPSMKIYQIDEAKQKVYGVEVKNVYPKIINDVVLSASDRALTSFQVVFAYETWASTRYEFNVQQLQQGSQIDVIDYNGVVRQQPKFMTDIAGIADLLTIGKEGIGSAIVTRAKLALIQILSTGSTSPTVGGVPGLDVISRLPTLPR